MAAIKETNPFYEDDDDDDFGFGRPRAAVSENSRYGFTESSSTGSGMTSLQAQKQNSANRQLDGTRRALLALNESEQIGVATAEELLRQGEQLDNVEQKATAINQDMKTSQKHLNNIKSIFGGLKNWWNGKNDTDESRSGSTPENRLASTVEKSRPSGDHPALRLRSEDVRGFYADDDDDDASIDERFARPSSNSRQKQTTQGSSSQSTTYEAALGENLNMMSSGLSNLKELAIGLGNEMDKQNEQLDRVNHKVERADILITDQNRQMRGVLGK